MIEKRSGLFVVRVLFSAFGMAVGLFIICAVIALIIMGGEKADALLERYAFLIFTALYLIALPIVTKKLSR